VAAARDDRGRFIGGHSGNPGGRPKVTTSERYLRKLARTVKISDWERIIETGIARAKAGDLGWARFLAEYLIGKPTQTVNAELTGADGGPIRTIIMDVIRDAESESL